MSDIHPVQALDAELAAIAQARVAAHAPPPFSGSPSDARERLRRAVISARQRLPLPVVGSVEDVVAVDDTRGVTEHVPVRVYRPVAESGPLPTIVFFHGGGFVLGSVELMDDIARKLCRDTRAVVVSVEYRLAPEHPFPAAHDDALVATRWAIVHVSRLGGDASRVAVAGESAGANLATSAAWALRGADRRLAAQLLVVPGVDMARDVGRIEAMRSDFPMLSANDLRDIARLYMGEAKARAGECPPSPLRAPDLAGMPPALVAVAGHDPLQDEGIAYANRLESAGVPVELYRFGDMLHTFFGMFDASVSARRASDVICHSFAAWLDRHALVAAR